MALSSSLPLQQYHSLGYVNNSIKIMTINKIINEVLYAPVMIVLLEYSDLPLPGKDCLWLQLCYMRAEICIYLPRQSVQLIIIIIIIDTEQTAQLMCSGKR